MKIRRNPLLSKPPRSVHGLDAAAGTFFRRMMGRSPTKADYEGVHTTTSLDVAAVYAMGAVKDEPSSYPVIIALNVFGLTALPDVDALAQASYILGDNSIRGQFDGVDLQSASDAWEYQSEYGVGDDVNSVVMESVVYGWGPMTAFLDLPDGEAQWDHWVSTGEYTPEAAIALVKQRRYITDFGFERVVRIDAMKRWWPEVLYPDDARVEEVESAGFHPVTLDELFGGNLLELKEIVRGPAPDRDVEYHGTSSRAAQLAFPEVTLPPNPFPTREPEDNPQRRLAKRLANP